MIFVMTGDGTLAKALAQDLAHGQTLRGSGAVDDLVAWLIEARTLSTGNLHWAVYDLLEHEVAPVIAAFPKGQVTHVHCGLENACEPKAKWVMNG